MFLFLYEIEKLMRKKIPNELLPENLIISKIFNDDEKPANLFDKNYHKEPSIKGSKGAFHEKKDKNKKVNLGGPGKRNPKFSKSGKLNKQRNTGKTRF
jgi:ATP-dependent RNA helicase RhlE